MTDSSWHERIEDLNCAASLMAYLQRACPTRLLPNVAISLFLARGTARRRLFTKGLPVVTVIGIASLRSLKMRGAKRLVNRGLNLDSITCDDSYRLVFIPI